jgi:hypothetical protein
MEENLTGSKPRTRRRRQRRRGGAGDGAGLLGDGAGLLGDGDGAGLLGDGDGAGSADMCGFCCVDPSVGEEGDDLKHLWYRLFLRTGTKVPLVPVRNNNRYQRCFRNSSALLIFLLTFRTGCLHQPVPKVFFFFI